MRAPEPPPPAVPTAPAALPPVRGLSAEQAKQPAAEFFARFPFEPLLPGQDELSAAEFLSFL